MATFEQKDNSGTLFKNDRKESPNQPDYTGNCLVNGKAMRMAAWIKEGKNGKFMSFSFSEPRPAGEEAKANGYIQDKQPLNEYPEEDLPF